MYVATELIPYTMASRLIITVDEIVVLELLYGFDGVKSLKHARFWVFLRTLVHSYSVIRIHMGFVNLNSNIIILWFKPRNKSQIVIWIFISLKT